MNHEERAHARVAPSSMERRLQCAGSLWMEEHFGITSKSKYSEEGTYAHECVEIAKKLRLEDENLPGYKDYIRKLKAEDSDLAYYVDEYVKFIVRLEERFLKGVEVFVRFIERRFYLTANVWGTADYVLLALRNDHWEAVVLDFKYGAGKEVSAFENPQIVTYLLAVSQWLRECDQYRGEIELAHLFIYQPRIGLDKPWSKYELRHDTIKLWRMEILEEAAHCLHIADTYTKENRPPTSDFKAGSHCQWCSAKTRCEAHDKMIKQDSLSILDDAPPLPMPIETIPIETLVKIHAKRKQIDSYLDAIHTYLKGRLENDLPVPGYELVETKTRRQWDPDQAPENIATVLLALGVEEPLLTLPKLIGIGDVEKQIGKGKIAALTTKTTPSVTLAPIADNRIAITNKSALELLDEL